MKKTISALSCLAALSMGGAALAHENPDGNIAVPEDGGTGYLITANEVVQGGSGDCLHTGSYSADDPINACEGIDDAAEPATDAAPAAEEAPREPIITMATLGGEALFDTDSAALNGSSEQALSGLIEQLKSYDEVSAINVVGHTDSRGAEAYNQALSERRAATVASYLADAYPNVEITSEGAGESDPIASNETPDGRQLNRRVDIQVTAKSITN